ncbi:CRISPR-associated protein Cas5 [Desulfovibrio sp. OttesenSCG-928-C14]|nr:CRISPR-associated protein Cas5 [Desulfovibrio sp. OttesenSCG-928-C14]
MPQLFYPIEMEIAGPTAMWTRPDTGDCPVSYPAPTYSAVKAIFESVLWGPAVELVPLKVELCAPVRFHSYVTNYGGPLRKADAVKGGNSYQLLATVLIDVCYKLYAQVGPARQKGQLPESARNWDKKTSSPGHAYQAIFTRRLGRGQCYSIPALGWREFTPSYYGPLRSGTKVISDLPDIALPSMLRQVFSKGYNSEVAFVYDQDLLIENGCLIYPEKRGAYA